MTRTPSNPETRSIELPASTVEALEARVEETKFETVDEYVAAALEQLLDHLYRHDSDDGSASTAEDGNEPRRRDDVVEDRLESLGYL